MIRNDQPRVRRFTPFDRKLFVATLGGIGGGVAAGFVAGAFARLAMRAVAVFGGILPSFTLEGTLFIVGYGAFLGGLAGLPFGFFQGFLPGSTRRKSFLYGLLLFSVMAVAAYASDPLPGEAALLSLEANLALFAPVFLSYGLILGLAADRLAAALRARSIR